MQGYKLRASVTTAGLALLLTAGCVSVKPWQKGRLADPTMTLEVDSEETLMFESREGSAGGSGGGGGGCACKR